MKKLLALVLAMVMTLGLATVGASAAAYTDADSIDFTEAVDVMSALKVFDGQNGAFNPDGVLTREQGAKIIAYMILGKSAADSLTTAKSSFADVAPERWSAGSIEYCVSTKIVGGAGKDANGNDVFNPEAELTGYAFAKMCLVALGYNPNYEAFVGGDWAINVAKVASDAGLNKDLASLVMSKGITRQQAAQMALNTEKATMVEYDNPINVKGSDGMEVVVGANRNKVAAGVYNYNYANNGAGYGTTTEDGQYTQFVERYNQSPKLYLNTAGTDDFGRPANTWRLGTSNVGKYGKTPTVTYTAAVKGGTVYSDLGGSDINFADMSSISSGSAQNRFTFHVNDVDLAATSTYGPNGTYATNVAANVTRSQTTNDFPGSGRGVLTEIFYDRTANTFDVIQSYYYLAKSTVAYDTTRKSLTVQVNPGAGTWVAQTALVTSISGEDFPVVVGAAKDTYYYVTLAIDTTNNKASVKSVTPVAADRFVPGVTVSTFSSSSITAGGTSYSKAANYADKDGGAWGFTLQTTKYDLILDPYGYVLSSAQTSSNTEYVEKYVFVNAAGQAGLSAQAEIIKMDGTTATVTVKKATTNTAAAPTTVTSTTDSWATPAAGTLITKGFYTYTTNDDGSYSLTYVTGTSTSAAWVKNVPSQNGAPTMNSKTAFVAGSSTSNLSAYLGIANFPGTDGSVTTYYIPTAPGGSTMAAMYAAGSAKSSTADKYVYLFKGYTTAKDSASSSDYYLYDAFIDGAKSADKLAAADASNGGLFKVSYNSKNQLVATNPGTYVTGQTAAFGEFTNVYMTASSGNITIVGGSATYALASGAEFYYVDCYNSNDSVTYTDAGAAAARTTGGDYKIVVVQKASDDPSIKEVWIITNGNGSAKNW